MRPERAAFTIALEYGTYPTDRAEIVREQVDALSEECARAFPWTRPYLDERRNYARAMVDTEDIRAYLDKVGMLDDKHHQRPAVRTLEMFVARHSTPATGWDSDRWPTHASWP